MRFRTPAAFLATGLLALAGVVGSVLPASAAEPAAADEAALDLSAVTTAADGCPEWNWDEVQKAVRILLFSNPSLELAVFDGTSTRGDVTEFRCLDTWTFVYQDRDRPANNGISVTLQLGSSNAPQIQSVKPQRLLPANAVDPAEAFESARAHGYDAPVSRYGVADLGIDGDRYQLTLPNQEYVVIDPATGAVRNSQFLDVPDDVTALRAATVSWSGTYTAPAFSCPAERPYLWSNDFGTGQPGTDFREAKRSGTLTVTPLLTADGLVTGWPETPNGISVLRAGDKDTPKVYALCTADPAKGYAPAAPTPAA